MLRKTTLMISLAFLVVSAATAPVSQGQCRSSFVGTWYLQVNLGSEAPTLTYGVIAHASPGHADRNISPDADLGNGYVDGPCELGPEGHAHGMAWRHTVSPDGASTGVAFTFEEPGEEVGDKSATVLLQGRFVTPDRIEGSLFKILDATDPNDPNFDPRLGRGVIRGTFTMERAQLVCVDPYHKTMAR